MSPPVKTAAASALGLFIETVATSIALSIIEEKRKQQNLKNNNEENNNVQLYSKSKRSEKSDWENCRLRLVDP